MEKKVSNKIFISSIPQNLNERILRDYFSQYGNIVEFHLSKYPNGAPKGSAILIYKHSETSKMVLQGSHIINGQRINLESYNNDKLREKRSLWFKFLHHPVMMEEVLVQVQNYGEVETAKLISSITGIITFKSLKTATTILNIKCLDINGTQVLFRRWKNRLEGVKRKERNHHQQYFNFKKRSNYSKNLQKGYHQVKLPFKSPNSDFENFYRERNTPQIINSQILLQMLGEEYFKNEFIPEEKLINYLIAIIKSNPQIKYIPKKDLKCLELFHFNERRRSKLGVRHKQISYYTMVKRLKDNLKQNHFEENLSFCYVHKNN